MCACECLHEHAQMSSAKPRACSGSSRIRFFRRATTAPSPTPTTVVKVKKIETKTIRQQEKLVQHRQRYQEGKPPYGKHPRCYTTHTSIGSCLPCPTCTHACKFKINSQCIAKCYQLHVLLSYLSFLPAFLEGLLVMGSSSISLLVLLWLSWVTIHWPSEGK